MNALELGSFVAEMAKVAGVTPGVVGTPATFSSASNVLKMPKTKNGTDGRLLKLPAQGSAASSTQGPRAYAPRLAAPGT